MSAHIVNIYHEAHGVTNEMIFKMQEENRTRDFQISFESAYDALQCLDT